MKKSNNDINLVIFGSGNRSLSVISKLKELDFNIVMVVTQKNKDLTLEESFPDLKLIFEENVNNIKFIQHLKGLCIDYFILSGFRQILKEEVLAIPSKATINLHAGKLPEYRGGSPLNWQIINGENYAYISTILTDKGIDTGNILVENQIKILDIDDIQTLHNKANNKFPEMTAQSIEMIENNDFGIKQSSRGAAYWHQRSDQDGYINFTMFNNEEVLRFIKGLTHPYPCAWGLINGEKVRIAKAEISDINIKGTPGKVLYLNNQNPYVVCSDGAIKLLEYYFENESKRTLSRKDKFS